MITQHAVQWELSWTKPIVFIVQSDKTVTLKYQNLIQGSTTVDYIILSNVFSILSGCHMWLKKNISGFESLSDSASKY